ncbi:MAG TPA: hypothetical protein VD978_08960 [Azospirillum sp.]|nr:hypothetical protein [Azospirillum sp.]
MTDDKTPNVHPEPVRGPSSGIRVPDSAIERHQREATKHVKPPPEDTSHKRPSADRKQIAEPWKSEE